MTYMVKKQVKRLNAIHLKITYMTYMVKKISETPQRNATYTNLYDLYG